MNRLPQSEYDALSRKLTRWLGHDRLASLSPSERGLLILLLNELLEARGAAALIAPEDMAAAFERVVGFPPTPGLWAMDVGDF